MGVEQSCCEGVVACVKVGRLQFLQNAVPLYHLVVACNCLPLSGRGSLFCGESQPQVKLLEGSEGSKKWKALSHSQQERGKSSPTQEELQRNFQVQARLGHGKQSQEVSSRNLAPILPLLKVAMVSSL